MNIIAKYRINNKLIVTKRKFFKFSTFYRYMESIKEFKSYIYEVNIETKYMKIIIHNNNTFDIISHVTVNEEHIKFIVNKFIEDFFKNN